MKRGLTQGLNEDLKAPVLQVGQSGSKHRLPVPTAWAKGGQPPLPFLLLDDFQGLAPVQVLAVLARRRPESMRRQLGQAHRETKWIHPTVHRLPKIASRSFCCLVRILPSIADLLSDPPKDQATGRP